MKKAGAPWASRAFRFVLAMGVVNLFADMTYEGGASINGPFLGSLGATAAAISIAAGLGEFLGYALRSVAGWMADRTGRYWSMAFVGYGVNLLAVPAMALSGHWVTAAGLVLLERVGRALRKPATETMLSYTTNELGRGWVFALNHAMDETGAALGPLLVTLMLATKGGYRAGYGVLLLSALLALAALSLARVVFPLPAELERGQPSDRARGFTRAYWIYMAAGACFAAGLTSFELISFHLASARVVDDRWIPLFVVAATVVGIAAGLVLGRLYDKKGIGVVVLGVVLSAPFAPLVFFGGPWVALAGMALWGVGYATQDTLLKAVLAGVLPKGKRGLAFGLFYAGYGAGWLLGSVVTGTLYEPSRLALVVFCVAVQLLSVPLFLVADHQRLMEPRL